MASIIKRNGSYFIMVSCGASSFAVLAEGDFLTKSPSCSRRDSSFPQKAGLFGAPNMYGKQVRRTMTYTPEPEMTAKQIEKEVQRQAILFEEKCKTGQVAESGCMKLSEFIEQYFDSHAEMNLKKKTIVGYRALAPIIESSLGHLRLDRITPQQITLFYRKQLQKGMRRNVTYRCTIDLKQLVRERGYATETLAHRAGMAPSTLRDALNGNNVSEKTATAICKVLKLPLTKTFTAEGKDVPLSNNTVRHYHSFLSSVLGVAVKWQLIPSNPCERATLPKKENSRPSSSRIALIGDAQV